MLLVGCSNPISTGSWDKWDCWTAAFRSQGHGRWWDTTLNGELKAVGKWACSLHTMGASSWAEWLWLVNAKHHWAFFHVTCRQLHTNVTGRLQNSTRVLTAIWSPLWAVVTEAEAVFSQCLYRTKPYNAEPILKYLQALICPINLKHYIN